MSSLARVFAGSRNLAEGGEAIKMEFRAHRLRSGRTEASRSEAGAASGRLRCPRVEAMNPSRADPVKPGQRIRAARRDEAAALSDLAFRSKAYWGYPREFMEACREELSITELELHEHAAHVLECDDLVVGFYALEHVSEEAVELLHLFVEPSHIRGGFGRALVKHACAAARAGGYRTLVIQSDPHATRFYESMGANVVGSRASASIPGRTLPLLELPLRHS